LINRRHYPISGTSEWVCIMSSESLKERFVSAFEGPLARLLLLPALAFIGIFVVFPIIWNVVLSFTNYSLIGVQAVKWSFIGVRNYYLILTDSTFYSALKNTVLFTIFSALIGQVVLGLALAVVIRMKEPEGVLGAITKGLKYIAITLVFISWIIPEVVAGYAWAAMTDIEGLLPKLLHIHARLYIKYPLQTIIIANIWRGTAFSMILFLAALESIPKYIYEAAEVDGATPAQRFFHVTLPLISSAIIVDFILITIWTFGVFTMPYIMLGPAEGMLWTLYVYGEAIELYMPSMAAAATNILFLIVLALILTYIKLLGRLRRWE